jgi:hypothetical protein
MAWSWDGTQAHPLTITSDIVLPPRPEQFVVDLRGDEQMLKATRSPTGVVRVYAGLSDDAPIVWQNEDTTWTITRMDMGDPNNDGRVELLLLLWKPDEAGTLRSHPFLMGWRGGYYRIIWGGSATPVAIQDLAVADLDNDGFSELVVLEGGTLPGDAGEFVSIWHWHGWGFQQEWQSPLGADGASRLFVVDRHKDGQQAVVVD